jgi:hypothetical protein
MASIVFSMALLLIPWVVVELRACTPLVLMLHDERIIGFESSMTRLPRG